MAASQQLTELYQRYLAGSISADEEAQLLAHFHEAGQHSSLRTLIEAELSQTPPPEWEQQPEVQAAFQRVEQNLRQYTGTLRKFRVSGWLSAAAALLIIGFGLFFIGGPSRLVGIFASLRQDRKLAAIEILPGYNQATLTLADGSTVKLDSAQSGIVIEDGDIKYTNGNSLPGVMLSEGSVKGASGVETSLPNLLSLSTPKGGQYQVILSDGTKVWLNAASTLKYPSKFTGDTRTVELEGEAYFSVNNKSAGGRVSRVPFIVETQNQATTVLGTEFNINSYDPIVKTTLVSGAVQVASYVARPADASRSGAEIPTRRGGPRTSGLPDSKVLKPGQQSINSEAGIQVKTVDVNSELAWRTGFFSFQSEDIQSVMRKLQRWYNVEVAYTGSISTERYNGTISRFENIASVLRMLEKTKTVHFSISGHTVTVHSPEQ